MTEVKPCLMRGGAGRLVVAVVLMHAERNLRIHLLQRVDHFRQHDVVGIGARAARGLDDDGRIDGGRRLHDRQSLLHVVDVERRHAVAVLGGMIQQLSQSDTCHVSSSFDVLHADVMPNDRAPAFDRPRNRARRFRDRFRRDAEFAVEHARRRGRAEARSCRRIRRRRRSSVPTRPRPRLRRQRAARRQNAGRYSPGLLREQFEAWRGDHGGADIFLREQAGGFQRDRHFGAGGDQGYVARALRLSHQIGAERDLVLPRRIVTECRQRLTRQTQHGWALSARNAQSQASAVSTASAGRNTSRFGIVRSAARCSTG